MHAKILAKHFRVLPQYEVAGRRIDLVIEGLKTRLAVECDGDKWHGPEQHMKDMVRQRTLERCGWIFWRVRGSEFYRNPDRALEPLWRKCDELGIDPQRSVAP